MMGIQIDSWRGRIALMTAHCAGMVDLVALPVWVGTLIAQYHFDPQQAGGLVTLFLAGVVLASALVAPRFGRVQARVVAALGFGTSAAGFLAAATVVDFQTLALLHGLCGVATGSALSVTHGTIARSARPHRLFAIVGMALGIFAVVFIAATPQVIGAVGGSALFLAFACVMAVASVIAALAFPALPQETRPADPATKPAPLPAMVWFGIVGIGCMTVVQAMTFSFLERAGIERGFERQAVNGVLIALGLVALVPAALAALLEQRLAARSVLLAGPVFQCLLVALIMGSTPFGVYAVAAALLPSWMVFVHTFAFGLMARLDPSGRVLAATPAMIMIGSAIGPVLAGTLVKHYGFGSLAVIAAAFGALAVLCFYRLPAAAGTHPSRETLA
jgi:predicted MFS family arabinose efflux permease